MKKNVIITCGLPRCGKTRYYKSNYNKYSYFNIDIPLIKPIEELEKIAKSGVNVYIEGMNPTIENRKLYSQLFKKYGYSVTCLWFTVPLEGILIHSLEFSEYHKKQIFYSQLLFFQSHFEPPTEKESFTVIEKISPIPSKKTYGDNKAIFISLFKIFAKPLTVTYGELDSKKFEIIHSQFGKIMNQYMDNGYKIILAPNKFYYTKSFEEVSKVSKEIAKEVDFSFTDIAFEPMNGRKWGIYKIANPNAIIKASVAHKIDLEKSIMVGEEQFEKELSVLSGCKYYFSKDVFFQAQNYVKMVLKGEVNDSNY